jgi:acyl dehydratase
MTGAALGNAPDVDAIVAGLRGRIGRRSSPITLEVEKGAIRDFARAIGEDDPLSFDEDYARASRFGALVAPPTYVSRLVPEVMQADLLVLDLPFARYVHGEDVVTSHRPILAGDVITAVGIYSDAFSKDGRQGPMVFQFVDVVLTRQDGAPVANVGVSAVCF